jgi:heme O synthase-like polyprenyltransferase
MNFIKRNSTQKTTIRRRAENQIPPLSCWFWGAVEVRFLKQITEIRFWYFKAFFCLAVFSFFKGEIVGIPLAPSKQNHTVTRAINFFFFILFYIYIYIYIYEVFVLQNFFLKKKIHKDQGDQI